MSEELSGVPGDVLARIHLLGRDGRLTARAVLVDAEDESSPLHSYFEWDDSAAALAFRLGQARSLIRRVKVTLLKGPDREPVFVNAFVAERDVDRSGEVGAYLSLARVAGDESAVESLRESMRRDLLRVKRRYENRGLLLEVMSEVMAD